MNGVPLPPQHGAPLRLVVPDWYGMASVKWLKEIRALEEPFDGVQQVVAYNYRQSEDDPGTPVTRKHPHALMIPPGIPDFLSRKRHLEAGKTVIQGRAWSGFGPVERVELAPMGRDLARRRPGRRRWSLRLDIVEHRVGRAPRRARIVRPGDGRIRKGPTARRRRGLEPGWVRYQRRPAHPRTSRLGRREGRATFTPRLQASGFTVPNGGSGGRTGPYLPSCIQVQCVRRSASAKRLTPTPGASLRRIPDSFVSRPAAC